MEYPCYFAWRNNAKRAMLYRRPCRVLARGRMNSVLIEMDDGELVVTSRNAVRRKPPESTP
jgi:hypothetical protein